MGRREIAVLGVLGLLLLSGCAQIAVHSTVDGDGTIAEYRMDINTSRTVYGFLEQSAQSEGYDNVSAAILSDVNESQREQFTYEEAFHGDSVTMTFTATDFVPPENGSISVTRTDGRLVYDDTTFYNETASEVGSSNLSNAMYSGLAVDYYLTMPGTIRDSNADSVDGNTAEWHVTGANAFNDLHVHAESDAPTAFGVPGFGVLGAIAAIFGAALVALLSERAADR